LTTVSVEETVPCSEVLGVPDSVAEASDGVALQVSVRVCVVEGSGGVRVPVRPLEILTDPVGVGGLNVGVPR